MSTERIAISGASGLIGNSLLEMLPVSSSQIVCLRRSDPTKKPKPTVNGESNSRTMDWEPHRGVVNPRKLEEVDVFFHLAGRSIGAARWNSSEKQRLRDSRVLATERLVEQICRLDRRPRVFISASAVGYYGDCGDDWVSEDNPPGHDFLSLLARDWEAAAQPLAAIGVRVVHARLGVVLSPRGGALTRMLQLFRWGMGGRLASGRQYWSWISLEDCCRGLIHMMNTEQADGPINLVSPNPVTNQEFTQILARVLHRPAMMTAPKWALKLFMGEMAEALLLSSCRAVPEKLEQLKFHHHHPQLDEYLRNVL